MSKAAQEQRHRVETRKKYREFNHQLEDVSLHDPNQIGRTYGLLRAVNDLFENEGLCRLAMVMLHSPSLETVKTPQDAVLDSTAIERMAGIVKAQNAHLDATLLAFTSDTFMDALKKRMKAKRRHADDGDDDDDDLATQTQKRTTKSASIIDWNRVGDTALRYLRPTPRLIPMLGPLAMDTAKKVIQRQAPRKTEALGVVMRPDTSDKVQDDKDPTTARVEMVMNKLDEHLEELDETDCCFFKFAFNPKSFSQTVENIFYISFLVKDNYVAVSYDDEGLPRLGFGSRAIESADGDEATAEQGGVKRQMMFNINHSLWNDIVKAFNITDCILPHRKSTLKE
eukprot:m.280805 g.280805  ORF g.280805 m.280805 type:complete len:340 (+) comp17736_c0_seq25:65-1084(+)